MTVPEWSAPAPTTSTSLSDISCPTTGLCVAVGGSVVLTSTNPTEATPSWHVASNLLGGDGQYATVSCASTVLCVVTDGQSVLISTNPLAEDPTWRLSRVAELPQGTVSLRGVPTHHGPKLTLGLDCVTPLFSECSGTATITPTEHLSANGHTITGVSAAAKRTRHRTVVIGESTFATRNDMTYTINVGLNHTGQRLLAKFKRLPANVSIRAAASELRVPPKLIAVKTVKVMFKASAHPSEMTAFP